MEETTKAKKHRAIISYLSSLVRSDTLDSSKSFSLVLSAIMGALIALCVCFCLVWDVCSNGYLKTDLDALGLFMLCVGGFMAGGGINKALSERKRNGNDTIKKEEMKNG